MACPHFTIRRRLRACAAPLAAGLAAAMISGCVLKSAPDAVTIKEQALPTVQVPGQWTASAAAAGAVADSWLAGFGDDQLTAAVNEAIAHNADLQVGAARVEQAQLHAKLAGAQALSVGRSARPRRRQVVRRWLRPPGRRAHCDVGGRSLGPRALRPCRQCRPSGVGGGRFHLCTGIDCRPCGQELVPGHRGRTAAAGGARNPASKRGARPPGR